MNTTDARRVLETALICSQQPLPVRELRILFNDELGADTIKALLKAQLTMGVKGADFDKDIKPLLGNPAVISATDVGSFLSDSEQAGFVAALQVSDKDALDSLIDKTKPQKRGEVGGATVYQDGDTYFAVDDDVVVLGGSRELLEAALKRADGGDHLSARNRFRGVVRSVERDGLLAQVEIDVTEPARVVAIVTAASVDALGLRPGAAATAIVKSTSVMVET